jgi:hypothetical protein
VAITRMENLVGTTGNLPGNGQGVSELPGLGSLRAGFVYQMSITVPVINNVVNRTTWDYMAHSSSDLLSQTIWRRLHKARHAAQ